MDELEKTLAEVTEQEDLSDSEETSQTASSEPAASTEEDGQQQEETSENGQKEKETRSLKTEIIEWIKAFVFAGVIVALIFGFVIRPVEVKGHSMEPTLQNSDRLIEWMLFYTPKQGDIVILSEKTGLDEALVKRVIATEGQTVDINKSGEVLVDGVLLNEDYIYETIDQAHYGDWDYPVTVPEGCIFVMGDNRNHSTDSRYAEVGFVDVDEVIGKVFLRLSPLSAFGLID